VTNNASDKPNTIGAGAAAGAASAAKPEKAAEGEEAKRAGSDEVPDKKKSRSTSRGIFNRLQGKKEELETKKEEKKAEKEEAKEEKKAEKEEAKEGDKTEEAAAAAAAGPSTGEWLASGQRGTQALTPDTAEAAAAAPVEEKAAEPAAETAAAEPAKAEEAKPSKRGSIFGRFGSGFSGLRSPAKEKDQKESELKPDVPPKDPVVADAAPQIPEPTTETTVEAGAPATEAAAEPKTEATPAEAAKEETASPKEKQGFLSFIKKDRNRSVSPSANMKEAPKKEEAKKEEPAAEAAAEPAAVPVEADKPAEPTTDGAADKAAAEPAKTENKRQSVLQGLGRRASKAFKGFQSPRKENDAPAAAAAAEPAAEEAQPTVNGETKPSEPQSQIGDVVGDAVTVSQPQTTPAVAASA
jgi:hypothetical protein